MQALRSLNQLSRLHRISPILRTFSAVGGDLRKHLDMDLIVGHDKDNKEFYIQLQGDGESSTRPKAYLQYDYVEKNCIDMYHTFVPDSFRGKGVAKLLAKEAMDHAVKEQLKMVLSCSYLQKYFNENPSTDYDKYVVK